MQQLQQLGVVVVTPPTPELFPPPQQQQQQPAPSVTPPTPEPLLLQQQTQIRTIAMMIHQALSDQQLKLLHMIVCLLSLISHHTMEAPQGWCMVLPEIFSSPISEPPASPFLYKKEPSESLRPKGRP